MKILEAAAYGRPIVSTPVGAEGLDLRDGRDILLRADPESFAQACIELLRDHTAAIRLGRSARQLVATTYDRDTTVARLGTMIQTALRETAPTCSNQP